MDIYLVPELVEGKKIPFIPAPPTSQGEEAAQREILLYTLRQAQGPMTLTIHNSQLTTHSFLYIGSTTTLSGLTLKPGFGGLTGLSGLGMVSSFVSSELTSKNEST